MKRFIYSNIPIVWLTCLALACGCSRSGLDAGEGAVSFSFSEDDAVRVKAGGAGLTSLNYTVDIVDRQGDTVAHYDNYHTVQTIRLREGVYTVYATASGDPASPTSAFGAPRYGGAETVTVRAGENTQVAVVCTLTNVKVTVVDFEQDIKDNFPEYSLVIKPTEDYTGSDTLTFTQADADAGQIGWIDRTKQGKFVLIFRAVNRQSNNKRQTYIRTITDAEPADFYRFSVKMKPMGSQSDGGTMFRLAVQTDTKEYEFPFRVKEHTQAAPTVSRTDGADIDEPLETSMDARDGMMRVNVHADAGIRRLRIRHEDAKVLREYGLPGLVELGGDNDAAVDEAQRTALAGILTWGDGAVAGAVDTWLDFSGLMNTARVDGELLPAGIYTVDVEIYDFDNQMVTQRVMMSVVDMSIPRDFSTGKALSAALVNGAPGVGAKYAYVTAQWLGSSTPTGLGFEYRAAGSGDDAWVKVNAASADIDEAQKSFRGLLTGLLPETMYEFRAVGDGLTPGPIARVTTDVLTELPNLGFEGGSFGKFDGVSDVYDPNIPGQERFWATGNPGGKYMGSMGLNKNVTLPVTGSEAHTGTALWMTSYPVNKFGVSSLASGTIYSGTFGPVSGIPSSSADQRAFVHYGQPYVARPLGLKGWYKYIPKTIDTDIDGKYPALKGQTDQCKIYISLEKWGAGVTSRPDKPTVIGYGELLSGATPTVADNNGYVPFEFRIEYDAGNLALPDHIVMCATCSYLSDDFCGGAGSTLYIDDFELVWEPTGLAAQ